MLKVKQKAKLGNVLLRQMSGSVQLGGWRMPRWTPESFEVE